MNLLNEIIARAKADKQKIVLPEGTEKRTITAADRLLADGVAEIILLGNPDEIKRLAAELSLANIGKAIIVDPVKHEKKQAYIDFLVELPQSKRMTP